jgi:hypothetical protein
MVGTSAWENASVAAYREMHEVEFGGQSRQPC